MDWAAAIPDSKEEIRASLSLAAVVYDELGILLDEHGGGICPFHDDTRPSFSIFESDDGIERGGCWACGWRGDVFDVIRAARNCSFQESVRIAKEYVGRTAAVIRPRAVTVRDFSSDLDRAQLSFEIDPSPVVNFIRAKGYPWTAGWLNLEWQVGVAAAAGLGSVMIPHLDRGYNCTGYKHRTAYTPAVSAGGSRFPELYGAWRDTWTNPVVLTEGESDTWAVTWYIPEVTALGLPTGAGTTLRAEWLAQLSGRDVIVCFDGDEAGRQAADRWASALPVRVIELPEGRDCVGLGQKIRSTILVG
jgi:hypothetical protein